MDLRITRTHNHQRGTDQNPWVFGFVNVPIIVETADNLLVMGDWSEHKMHAGIESGALVTTEFWKYVTSTKTLYMPNGWVATYETLDTNRLKLSEVHDQFGNSLTCTFTTPGSNPFRVTQVVQTVNDSGATRSNAQGIVPQINGAFRSIADQATMRRLRPTLAARGPSWHEAGGALDLHVSNAQRSILVATMRSYGFRNGANWTPSEPWHFDGQGFLGSRSEAISRAQTAWTIGNIRPLR